MPPEFRPNFELPGRIQRGICGSEDDGGLLFLRASTRSPDPR
jgi:hypothetical protein